MYFDIIGLSYYPFWHGKMEQLENNMNDVSARYNKDVVVVETAMGFTNDGFDAQKKLLWSKRRTSWRLQE